MLWHASAGAQRAYYHTGSAVCVHAGIGALGCEGAGLRGSPRGPNLADVQDREMSTFPGEFRCIPAVQSSWDITRASVGARGERGERDAAPERARGPKQASGMCLARRARSRSSARAARVAPPRARLSSLGRRLGRESGPEEHQGRSTGASKRAHGAEGLSQISSRSAEPDRLVGNNRTTHGFCGVTV